MKVFKFGGASVRDAAAVRNVANILRSYAGEPLVVVVSAMGKTTNALEEVVNAYTHPQPTEGAAVAALTKVKEYHYSIVAELFGTGDTAEEVGESLNEGFVEIEWILEETPSESYDYIYDQIVSIGEFLSTRIVSAYLTHVNIANNWLDARDVIRTDNTYREGVVDWSDTEARIQRTLSAMLERGIVVTQGFIGGTSENFTTTLGREGSDYSAAIFAHCLNADSLTVWKDVDGILSADPRRFPNATLLPHLRYSEAIEMTRFGATVLHPKTMKPLMEKSIELHVRSFLNPNVDGTVIAETFPQTQRSSSMYGEITVIAVKKEQIYLSIRTRDSHFIDSATIRILFTIFERHRIAINLLQMGAVQVSVVVDSCERLADALAELRISFHISEEQHVHIVSIANPTPEAMQEFGDSKKIYIRQFEGSVVRFVQPAD